MIIWDTLSIMEKSDKIDTVWFLNFIMATQKKELVVRKNSQVCHWNSPRAIFFLTTCTVQYNTLLYGTNFIRGEFNSKEMRWFSIKSPTAIRFSAKFIVFYTWTISWKLPQALIQPKKPKIQDFSHTEGVSSRVLSLGIFVPRDWESRSKIAVPSRHPCP